MEPENQTLQKEIPIGKPSFPGSMLNFGGVFFLTFIHFILLMVEKSREKTTRDVWNLVNNGINYQPQLVQGGFYHQYGWCFKGSNLLGDVIHDSWWHILDRVMGARGS